jgi:parallel beta-helix repeat protein
MLSILIASAFAQTPPVIPPNKSSLTIVSKTSNMAGDLKCSGDKDEVEIQTAIDYFASGGGEIILSEGVFTISDQIVLVANLAIKGQGMSKTTIKSSNSIGPFKRGAGTIRGVNINNIVLSDFTGHGNRLNNLGNAYDRNGPAYGKYGFFCEVCDNLDIQRVGIYPLLITAMNSYTGYGFDPHGDGSTGEPSRNMLIDNCQANDNNWDGFAIDRVVNGKVTNNVANKNGRHGINIITGR